MIYAIQQTRKLIIKRERAIRMIDMESALTFVFELGNLGMIYHFLQKMFLYTKSKNGAFMQLNEYKIIPKRMFNERDCT